MGRDFVNASSDLRHYADNKFSSTLWSAFWAHWATRTLARGTCCRAPQLAPRDGSIFRRTDVTDLLLLLHPSYHQAFIGIDCTGTTWFAITELFTALHFS